MIKLREFFLRHLSAYSLNLHLQDRGLPAPYVYALLAFHFLGTLAIVRLTHQPLWLVLIPVLLIQPLAVSWRLKRAYLPPESLAPMGIAYGVLLLRLLIAVMARFQGLTTGPLTVPEPWGGWLNLNLATGLGGLWALMAQAGPTAEAFGRRLGWKTLLGWVVAVLSLAWAALTYLKIRTHGVTGSDPYAYVQMALDIAHHGTPLHIFPLAPQVAEWGLPTWPVVPIGYNPPDLVTGTAATVWPPGYSALLAFSFWIGGETGLYLLTPLLGLVALVAGWCLCLEVNRTWEEDRRFLAAGIAVFVLATSYEQVDRLAVPMADVPSQLFTTLTILFALRATRGRTVLFASLSGLCLGIAFAIRHTQVLLLLSVLFIWVWLWFSPEQPTWRRAFRLGAVCFGAGALLLAVPVLRYNWIAFGGPLRVGSAELGLLGLGHVPRTVVGMTKALLNSKEFLYLLPFLGWGAIQLWRRARRMAAALLVWLLVIGLFHLSYEAVRLRDLLSVFPVLAVWVGIGLADALIRIQRIGRSGWRKGAQVLVLGLLIALLWTRTQVTLGLLIHAPDFHTFGYLRPEQRAAFDALKDLTPTHAIVATSLNSGPIYLYAERDAVRPAYWSQDEWLDLVARALKDGRTLYLLMDGVEMDAPYRAIQSGYQLSQVSSLPVPYFYPDGNSQNLRVTLYEVLR